MRPIRCFVSAVCLAALVLAAQVHADAGVAGTWQRQASAVSAGADTAARGAAITARLDALGIAWRAEAFQAVNRAGESMAGRNLLADLGGPAEAPLLLIGAHYDRVEIGHGAMDNASGVATVLALAELFQQRPLAGHRVQVAFWDLEEHGLLGSRAWVQTPGRAAPALYLNFDVFGWGDTLWMMDPEAGASPLATLLAGQAPAVGLGFRSSTQYPPTDHMPFHEAGWPAVSFSLMDAAEVDGMLRLLSSQVPDPTPKVMQVIHSPRDTVEVLEAADVPRAVQVLEAAVRAWDAGDAGAPSP